MSSALPFENTQIEVSELPALSDLESLPMNPKYKTVRILIWLIIAAIFSAVTFVLLVIFKEQANLLLSAGILTLYGVLMILTFLTAVLGYRHMAYAVRSRDIYFKRGWIFRKSTVVPFNRIQHCEVNHGPIDRLFGLASLKVFTAGGSSSDLEIPGLSESRANRLKDFITKKTGLDEEE